MDSYEHINVKPMTVNVGSEISGVDLRQPSPHAASEIKRALIDRKVLVFHDQELTPHQYKDFMQIFGTPVKEDMDVDAGHPPEVGAIHIRPDERQRINFWHMDNPSVICRHPSWPFMPGSYRPSAAIHCSPVWKRRMTVFPNG